MAKDHSLSHSLQRITQRIVTGLFLIFPFTATVIVLLWIVGGSDNLVRAVLSFVGLPDSITWNPIISVVFTLFMLYMIGSFSTFLLVRRVIALGERLVRRIPVVSFIYNTTKQIIEAISMQSRDSFKKVVLIEYPRRGMFGLGFVTGETKRFDGDEDAYINVFLPTTPNPTSGFLLLLPRTDVYDTGLTIEEGVKMIISGGILTPKPLGVNELTQGEMKDLLRPDKENVLVSAIKNVNFTPPDGQSPGGLDQPPASQSNEKNPTLMTPEN